MGVLGCPPRTFVFYVVSFYVCSEQNCKLDKTYFRCLPHLIFEVPLQTLAPTALTPDSQGLCSATLQCCPTLQFLFPQKYLLVQYSVSQDSALCNVNMTTNGSMCYFSSGHMLHFNRYFLELVLIKGVHRRQQVSLGGCSLKCHSTVFVLSVEMDFYHFAPSLITPLITEWYHLVPEKHFTFN